MTKLVTAADLSLFSRHGICPNCRGHQYKVAHTIKPHPIRGEGFEAHMFRCAVCEHVESIAVAVTEETNQEELMRRTG
jgi:hypothetical protein